MLLAVERRHGAGHLAGLLLCVHLAELELHDANNVAAVVRRAQKRHRLRCRVRLRDVGLVNHCVARRRHERGVRRLGRRERRVVPHECLLYTRQRIVRLARRVDLRLALVGVRHLADSSDELLDGGGNHGIRRCIPDGTDGNSGVAYGSILDVVAIRKTDYAPRVVP